MWLYASLSGLPTKSEHVVAFYRSDDFVVEQVASFITEGLAANEHVIAIASDTALRKATRRSFQRAWRRAGLERLGLPLPWPGAAVGGDASIGR